MNKKITVIGNGSFATALVKILTENKQYVNWWMRSESSINHLKIHHHNLNYLSSVNFDTKYIHFTSDINEAVTNGVIVLIVVPSAFVPEVLSKIDKSILQSKIILSAIKGILPGENLVLNEYLETHFNIPADKYCCITGPCHAEEIALEKLSYLTFSSINAELAKSIASLFETHYLRTVTTSDVYGVQFAAVLKNIYALGAGIAHGLDYGDNFMSVYITNCFAEMQEFMKAISQNKQQLNTPHHYNTSAYLGDLLVTSYSLHSRNRRFGNMLGKGYSVEAAKLELNMVAEGYYAAKCITEINK